MGVAWTASDRTATLRRRASSACAANHQSSQILGAGCPGAVVVPRIMKFGINTLRWTDDFDLEQVPPLAEIRKWGYDGLEITRRRLTRFPARILRESARNEGLDLTLCASLPEGLSLVSAEESVRSAALEYVERAIEMAAELGSPVLAGPFFSQGAMDDEDTWRRGVEAVQILTAAMRECDVTLAVEPQNCYQSSFLRTCSDAAHLCRAVHDPYLGVTFDTFHANIEEDHPAAALAGLEQYLTHVHVAENHRGMPGSGHLPWMDLFTALQENQYAGWVVVEAFTGDPENGLRHLHKILAATHAAAVR